MRAVAFLDQVVCRICVSFLMVWSHREKVDNAGQPSDGEKRGSGRESRRGTVFPLNVTTPSRNSGETRWRSGFERSGRPDAKEGCR